MERNDVRARGVKVPNWECPNWTELPTIRHSLAAKPSTEEKKGEEKAARSFYRVPYKFTRRDDDDDDVTEGKKIASRKVSTACLLPYVSFTNAQTTRDPEKKVQLKPAY